MKLQVVPARQGLVWVRQGLQESWRHPLAYASLFVLFMLPAQVLWWIPVAGPLAVLAATPLLSLAYMMATLGSLRDHEPRAAVFIVPWRSGDKTGRIRLLTLCLVYAACFGVVLVLCNLIDGNALDRLLNLTSERGSPPTEAEVRQLLESPGLLEAWVARFSLLSLLGTVFWHAPALVFWGQQSVAQALFSSALAVWRSKLAFLVYMLGWVAAGCLAIGVVGLMLSLLGAGQVLTVVAFGTLSLALTTAFYVSLLFTFQDSFGVPVDKP